MDYLKNKEIDNNNQNNLSYNEKIINDNIINKEKNDDPYRRQLETNSDLKDKSQPISLLRLKALEQARRMPSSYGDNSHVLPEDENYFYAQRAAAGKSNWIQIGPTAIAYGQTASTYYQNFNIPALIAGRLTSIVLHPKDKDIIYVGTASGGIWKTKDGGRNWIATSDYAPSLGIGALAMDPQNHDVLYAGTGEGNVAFETLGAPEDYYGCGILKTNDGGNKWELCTKQDNLFNGASFYRIVINNQEPSRIFAATNYGLFRSFDHGENWKKIDINNKPVTINNNQVKVTDVIINPKNPNIVYVGVAKEGVYKSYNANDSNPVWKKIDTKDDLNSKNISRISLTICNSNPNILYILMASFDGFFDPQYEEMKPRDIVDRFYIVEDNMDNAVTNCERISLPGVGTKTSPWFKDSIGGQGDYNLNVAVHPKDPDIVFLSGVSLWKATRNTSTNKWNIRDIGLPIHPDHHAFAFDPIDPSTIYAGSDGGLYKSNNGGEIWSDSINEGFCITQFGFIDQHPTSDVIIFGGTQDNGTLQYRNSPAFYFSASGDGGFVCIDKDSPNNIIHQYIQTSLYHSKEAGQINSWKFIPVVDNKNKRPPSLFYAPFTLDQTNSKNIAFGSDRIFLDKNQGLGRWKTQGGEENSIKLPFLDKDNNGKPTEVVSAINFVNSDLIYAGTSKGKVIRAIKKANDDWEAHLISNTQLPKLYIWDIATMSNNLNEIVIIMAGWGTQEEPTSYIWHGISSEGDNKPFIWQPINGNGIGKLPETPINALVIDNKTPGNIIFIGTDIGVFKSTNKGESWVRFSENLPVCAVYDMRLHPQARKLRVATYGRGIWERNLDNLTYNDVNIFIRNHLMDTESLNPSDTTIEAAFSDPLQDESGGIKLYDELSWDMCPDIKIDSAKGNPSFYQFENIDDVDYVKFETRLQHRNPNREEICNIFVQIHNKGIAKNVENASIKLFYANMRPDGTYPELPETFWNSYTTYSEEMEWKSISTARTLPEGRKTLTNTEPTVLAWQWLVPNDINHKAGILVIVESTEDPIKPNHKILNVEDLVKIDRHVGLKTITVNG